MQSAAIRFVGMLSLAASLTCLMLEHGADVLAHDVSGRQNEASVRLPEQTFFSKGPYSAFAFTFAAVGRRDLAMPRDYGAQWTLDPAEFPRGAELEWTVPVGPLPLPFGVWGYHHIDYGNYDASLQKESIEPRRVCEVTGLEVSFDVEWSGSRRFNLLSEVWLTRTGSRTESNSTRALLEVGFLLYSADRDFHNKGQPIGRGFSDGRRTYTVRRTGKYITFAPDEDVASGDANFGAALKYLMTEGVISGSEFVNGVAFGVEPIRSDAVSNRSGKLHVRDFHVNFNADSKSWCRQ
jgi:hypothetical protein